MKRTFQILCETLALPFSELFFHKDLIIEALEEALENAALHGNLAAELRKRIDERVSFSVADEINRHTVVTNMQNVQDMVNYVYNAADIAQYADRTPCPQEPLRSARAIMQSWYFLLAKRIARTFLTVRDGKAAFQSQSGQRRSYPHTRKLPSGRELPLWERDLLGEGFQIQRIEAWHSLLQCIPESFLLSTLAAGLAENESAPYAACLHMLTQFGDTVQIADAMLEKVLSRGLAETHLHAGASRTFDRTWETLLQNASDGKDTLEKNYDMPFRERFTRQNANKRAQEVGVVRALLTYYLCVTRPRNLSDVDFLASLESLPVDAQCRRQLKRASLALMRNTEFTPGESDAQGFSQAAKEIPTGNGKTAEFLYRLSGTRHDALSAILRIPRDAQIADVGLSERLFMALAMTYIAKTPQDEVFSTLFLYYLRLKHIFYRYRAQDSKSKGLAYFQRVYDLSSDSGELAKSEKMLQILYAVLRDERVRKTELRFSPPVSRQKLMDEAVRKIGTRIKEQLALLIRQHLFAMIQRYGSYGGKFNCSIEQEWNRRWDRLRDSYRQNRMETLCDLLEDFGVCPEARRSIPPHRVGIIYHLIKWGETRETPSCFVRFSDERNVIKPMREEYANFSFGDARFQYEAAVRAIVAECRRIPEVRNVLLGLDAASLELAVEPWVFAPAFRLARALEWSAFPKEGGGRRNNLGFTYHVGEEFRHPLSGLRHIGEAIDFFQLQAGDRLGHALALGVNLNRWFDNHRLMTLSLVEWMENCLWAWEIAAQNPDKEDLHEFSQLLETEILKTADEIYGSLNGITVKKLSNAYRAKTLSVEDLEEIVIQWCRKNECVSPVNCSAQEYGGYYPCVSCSVAHSANKEYWWSEDALILSYHCDYYKTRMNQEFIKRSVPEEIDLSNALQRYLRGVVAKKGLILEENPSSNAVIGEMDGILSHPIHDLRKNAPSTVITSINTDDPSVFNSNVANEHALIYYTLIYHGYSVEEALNAIDTLRKAGMNSSFLCDPVPFEQLLEEYERILHYCYK